ncbi:C40 family peptidase [Hyphomonas sp. WL0036]|uniref:C40 family peptidase n=1 Tax=Hyphomonas sediminis TaxID=2866160 RepID=UPI001C822E48|nr:NlpC/P60 family protein [Hyphomonas sediminis]MBY9065382.1 C40 family peptidase [Hyphomonas sediminis]
MPDFNDPRLARPAGPATLFQVASGAVAVRKAPRADAEAGTFALHGETLDVFGQEGAFARVQCRRDRYTGWALAAGLAPAILTPTHKVSALRTYAFPAPDVKAPPVLTLSLGARVTATGLREGAWVECARAGWVHERHLAGLGVFEGDPAGVASRFLGAPYLWGGRESLGLDCSGLTQQAFEACGVLLPRDSDMQMAWSGTEVTPPVSKSTQNDTVWAQNDTLRRGDLVFWEGHVGILTAPGHLLHANAHHMMTAEEPLAEAVERIGKIVGPVLSVRRIDLAAARAQPPVWL